MVLLLLRGKDMDSTVLKVAPAMCTIGVGQKFIGRRMTDNRLGIVKFPLYDGSLDCLNEVVCFELGSLFGFDVVEASMETYDDKDCVISCYADNSLCVKNDIKTLKSWLGTVNFHQRFNVSWIREQFGEDSVKRFIQMLMFDYLTRQHDRHINNIAFTQTQMYSLYDNGRSLFFDADEFEKYKQTTDFNLPWTIRNSFYTNEHGYAFTYLEDIVGYYEYKRYIASVRFEDIQSIFKKYYKGDLEDKGNWLADYVWSVYKILLHISF